MSFTVRKVTLDLVSLDEVAKVIDDGIKNYFKESSVSIVNCPDLTQNPFNLAASGLGGNCRIADVGGPPYLVPLVQRNKIYSFQKIAKLAGAKDEAFLIGASAGPFRLVGQNCELMPNVLLREEKDGQFEVVNNNTHYSKVFLFCYSNIKS